MEALAANDTRPFGLAGRTALYRGVWMTPAAAAWAADEEIGTENHIAALMAGKDSGIWRLQMLDLCGGVLGGGEYVAAVLSHVRRLLLDLESESLARCPELPPCRECGRGDVGGRACWCMSSEGT